MSVARCTHPGRIAVRADLLTAGQRGGRLRQLIRRRDEREGLTHQPAAEEATLLSCATELVPGQLSSNEAHISAGAFPNAKQPAMPILPATTLQTQPRRTDAR